jgi:hypothetical protein
MGDRVSDIGAGREGHTRLWTPLGHRHGPRGKQRQVAEATTHPRVNSRTNRKPETRTTTSPPTLSEWDTEWTLSEGLV